MGKTVWIMNQYASHMLFNKGGRHYNFAKYLARDGYDPVVFCANLQNTKPSERYFDTEALWTVKMAEEINVPFVYVKTRPYQGNGMDRVLNMIDFYRQVKKAAKQYAEQYGKPDIILASSVHPLTLVAGIQLAKYYHVKCICEVRDLWPESLVAYGFAGPHNPIVVTLRVLEKWIYRRADALIFTTEGMYNYIIERGWEQIIPREKVHYINNGVDLETFDYNCKKYRTEDEELENPDLFKVIYTGSIRRVNNLSCLLDAAKLVKNENIVFLIWGFGDELERLRQRVKDEQIRNVIFKGKVEKCYVPFITSSAHLNIAHNTPSSLFKYGISFNKLFEYMASGRPILCDFPCEFNPAMQANAGFEIQAPNAETIAEAIDSISRLESSTLEQYGKNARAAAERLYDFSVLTRRLIETIEEGENNAHG